MSRPFTKGRNSPGKGVRRQTMRNERQRFSRVPGYLLFVSALLLIALPLNERRRLKLTRTTD